MISHNSIPYLVAEIYANPSSNIDSRFFVDNESQSLQATRALYILRFPPTSPFWTKERVWRGGRVAGGRKMRVLGEGGPSCDREDGC